MKKRIIVLAVLILIGIIQAKETSFQRSLVRVLQDFTAETLYIEAPLCVLNIGPSDDDNIELKFIYFCDAGEIAQSRKVVSSMKSEIQQSESRIDVLVNQSLEMIKDIQFEPFSRFEAKNYKWNNREYKISPKTGTKIKCEMQIKMPSNMVFKYSGIGLSAAIEDIGDINISSEFAKVELTKTNGYQSLVLDRGEVSLDRVEGDFLCVGGNIRIEGDILQASDIKIAIEAGNIDLYLEKEFGKIDIVNVNDNTKIETKQNFHKVTLFSEDGKVNYKEKKANSNQFLYKDENGTGTISVYTERGNIDIR